MLIVLRHGGFRLAGASGSHQKWRNGLTGKQVIVPYHRGRILPLGTMRAIIEGSGIEVDAWFDRPAHGQSGAGRRTAG